MYMIGFLIALLSGALMSIQGVFNTQVTKTTGMWVGNGWVQFTAFAVCLAMWFFTGRDQVSQLMEVQPKYMLLGGVIGGAVYCHIRRKSFWQMADIACMGVLIGQIIGKWGSFFNRESFGEYADNIFSMQLPLTAVRAGEVTTAMREKLQTVDSGTWILVQPLFFYESLWCLLVLLMLMMLLRKKVFQGEIFLKYLAGYGLGRAVLQWFRTDKILFLGTGVDVSLVISVILFVLCTVVVAVKRVMSRKRAKVRMRRIEKDQQAEKEAEQQRENVAENLETETVQGEKNGSERDTEERGSSSESVTFAAAAGGTEEAGQPDQEQERSSEESGG